MTTISVVECLPCCFWLEGCFFNEGQRTECCRCAAAGIPTFHTETFGTKKRESYGIWRNENSNKVPFRCGAGIFHNFAFPELPKINVRNVPGDGAQLIRLARAPCTAPPENDEFSRVQTLVSLPADGAAFPWPAAMPKADSCIHPT